MIVPIQPDAIHIRLMRPEDLQRVQEIDHLSFTMPWPESAYVFELNENPLSTLWVAEDTSIQGQGTIVGMIVLWYIIDEAHIATLAIHPSHRTKGIAKFLLITALKNAWENGMRSATLEVRANNGAAQALYQQFGFEIVGRRSRYYRDNHEDALIMTADPLCSQSLANQVNALPENLKTIS